MKNLKLLIYTLILGIAFSSCTNKEPFQPVDQSQESETVQNVITELRTHIDNNGNLIPAKNPANNIIFDFCFDFVYPIELIYNNGSTVTVNSFQELITVIINSTPNLYIVGIVFPFDVEVYNPVTNEIEIITIHNETEFIALLESCDLGNDCPCPTDYDPVCVDVEQNGQTITITFQNSCYAECAGFTPNEYYPCVGGCGCPTNYDPVCVEDNGIIIEFDNECLALCEGYTPNDFIPCPVQQCEINDLTVVVGDCNTNGTYNLTVNFEHVSAGNDYFDVFIRNGEFIGTYALADLPLTLENFEISGFDYDYLRVCINDNPDCCEEIEWMPPSCNTGDCDITNLTVDTGACNPANNTYPITIDFDHVNAGNDYFDVYVRNGVLVGYYALADLPLTIDEFEFSGYDYDYIKVCINDNPDCCEELEWMPPACDDCNCPQVYDPVCVEVAGEIITYYNACYAECDGFTNYVTCVDTCNNCINEPYDPICVEFNGVVLTMYNECFLFCNGFTPNNIIICD